MTVASTQGRSPFMPVIPEAGTAGKRNPINGVGTEQVLRDFTEGDGAIAVNEGGQVTSTNSSEFKELSARDREKIAILSAQIRSFR